MKRDIDGTAFAAAGAAIARRFDDDVDAVADEVLDDIATVVQDNVRAARRRHHRTGKGERLISVHATGSGSSKVVRVHAGGRVAHLITGGTAPHLIRALPGRALSLAGTAQGYAAAVHHPGTRPDPFVAKGVAASSSDIARITATGARELAADLATDIRRS